ncbi:ATPase [Thermocladium modestius]|uniref:ATPase n=1 Tax=Thermocladium modestius TaxID=62609 RepID=A0A830GVS9_9CREN|nr:ATPase, T2SS/T4P/T4SS family [Thermocladium modestius]GGP21765.1 ATPase [Thermocladium modestius]
MLASDEVYVPDVSVIVDGSLREAVIRGEIRGKILIHSLMVRLFEEEERKGSSIGKLGIEELEYISDALNKMGLTDSVRIEYIDTVPREVGRTDDVDVIAREVARELGATLVTSDQTTKNICEIMRVKYLYLGKDKPAELERMFQLEGGLMSVHLKEDVAPLGKRGKPGAWEMVPLGSEPMRREQLEKMVRELISMAHRSNDTMIEVRRDHSLIIQHKDIRVVAVFPPVSDGIEITAVKPLVKRRIEDYSLHPKVLARLEEGAEGILIAGSPGAGKTTFAQALAEFYLSKNRIVKTIESPRDMTLPPQVTQLSKTMASSEEIHDILLLSRPDYTIFDEMRDTADFQVYVDLRLAGIGMVGVVHATTPIDAIQRFIGRVELGMLPSIMDTIIFMDKGDVSKVYSLEMSVKIPEGMREQDLARPVVTVRDFINGDAEYEVYVFGEETFVVPIRGRERPKAQHGDYRVISRIARTLRKYVPPSELSIEYGGPNTVVIRVPEGYMGITISRVLPKLEGLKRKYNVDIRVEPRE